MDCIVGHIEYENKDTTSMNKQKERYLYYHEYYINKGKNIATTIAVLDYLTTHQEDFQNLAKTAPAFMRVVVNNFWARAVMDLYSFYYDNNDLSFHKFFCYIKSNWNLIFTGDFYEYIYHGKEKRTKHIRYSREKIFEAIKNCQDLIKENQSKIDTLKIFRDKVFAHFSDESKQKDKIKISIDLLQELLSVTERIINKFEIFYNRTITSLNPVNVTDIHQICYALSKFYEYRSEIRELDLQKMKANIGDNT